MDLPTLWYLTTGTLLVATAMTLWERKAHALRSRELGLWAAAYGVLTTGCVLAMNRKLLGEVLGPALTNLVMILGYLLLLQGVLALDRRKLRPMLCGALLAALGAAWLVAGSGGVPLLWSHVGAFPIALICAMAALALLRSRTAQGLRSRPIAIAALSCHSLFYGLRSFAVPVLVAIYGEGVRDIVAEITMYEAVLFTIVTSMSLLALVREEDQARLLATARTDFLTGLNNRQGFFELAPRRLSDEAKGVAHSLLAIDLDHFKAINDQYGHGAGDRVLKLFADVAREISGPDAMSARLGGEEFAILLPNMKGLEAHAVGQSIARRFAEAAARSDGLAIQATVSIGLAEASSQDADLIALLAAADRALYQAKMHGRNRIEIAKPGQAARAA